MKKYYRLYSSLPQNERHLTRAEIDLGALAQNFRTLKSHLSPDDTTRMIAVVKADAYGHGAPACVRTLLREGCDFFAVSCIDEAVTVRATCKEMHARADILILGYTPPPLATELSRFELIQTLLSEEYAKALDAAAAAAKVTLPVHIAVDTGMNRIGYPAHSDEEIFASADAILATSRLSHLSLCGMFTHFSRADEEDTPNTVASPSDCTAPSLDGAAFTALQSERYRRLRREIEQRGCCIPFHHVCNSAASLLRPEDRFDGVRPGILLYGVLPLASVELPLTPVLKLRTAVMHLHTLLPGEGVGYGATYRSATPRLIATLPIGYADGLLRAYRGAEVFVESSEPFLAPIVGRICMDQCMIDVTGHSVAVGDTVTFFGNHPSELSAYAKRAGTIEYECLCIVSSRVPRQYTSSLETEDSSV